MTSSTLEPCLLSISGTEIHLLEDTIHPKPHIAEEQTPLTEYTEIRNGFKDHISLNQSKFTDTTVLLSFLLSSLFSTVKFFWVYMLF